MAAEAAAQAGAALKNFRKHRAHVHALGDRMEVVAVGADECVIGAQGACDAGSDRLLSDAEVQFAVDFVRRDTFETGKFELTHPHHVGVPFRERSHAETQFVESTVARQEASSSSTTEPLPSAQ